MCGQLYKPSRTLPIFWRAAAHPSVVLIGQERAVTAREHHWWWIQYFSEHRLETTNAMLRSVLLVLFLAWGSSASPFPADCDTPTLENGWVEVQQRSSGLQETPKVYGAKQSSSSSFVGRFHCHPGFDLSGSETVKCLGGVWSARSLPVCTAMGSCEEELLPSITNGFRRGVGKLTNSVFR